jgi:hypothetical protein
MKEINKLLDIELSKDKPNKRLIDNLNKVLNRGIVTFSDFIDTGRFVPADVFSKESGTELDKETTEVVLYFGKYYIEVRKPDTFVYGNKKSKKLKDVETYLWECVQKVINK